ncbi:T9SS type A sorting domain-containing protein [Soonwooa sp.]|uniref:T9SS type A sorting domain-containing protein n=1 Tax=Soonwooa sp. TaxID=1938592 RepID=UPI0026025BC2|nr:T9SS type A sorting domain-containing protein [Soonwooa sp.]
MKKQLLFALLLVSTGIFAQKIQISKTLNAPAQQVQVSNKASVLVNQAPSNVTVAATIDPNYNFSIYTADDISFPQSTTLKSIKIAGQLDSNSFFDQAYRGGHFIIFEDNNGKPAGKPANAQSAKFNFDFDQNNTAVTYQIQSTTVTFTIDLTNVSNSAGLSLDANKTYWIAFAAKVDFDEADSSVWYNFLSDDGNNNGYFIDENDSFNQDFTNWTPLAVLELPSTNNVNMLVEGASATLGVKESFSTKSTFYPNPSSSKITLLDADKTAKVQIYNLAGSIVLETVQKDVDVSKLAKGNYIVKQILKDGSSISSKFIKN